MKHALSPTELTAHVYRVPATFPRIVSGRALPMYVPKADNPRPHLHMGGEQNGIYNPTCRVESPPV